MSSRCQPSFYAASPDNVAPRRSFPGDSGRSREMTEKEMRICVRSHLSESLIRLLDASRLLARGQRLAVLKRRGVFVVSIQLAVGNPGSRTAWKRVGSRHAAASWVGRSHYVIGNRIRANHRETGKKHCTRCLHFRLLVTRKPDSIRPHFARAVSAMCAATRS